jgi:hypothetical protein
LSQHNTLGVQLIIKNAFYCSGEHSVQKSFEQLKIARLLSGPVNYAANACRSAFNTLIALKPHKQNKLSEGDYTRRLKDSFIGLKHRFFDVCMISTFRSGSRVTLDGTFLK